MPAGEEVLMPFAGRRNGAPFPGCPAKVRFRATRRSPFPLGKVTKMYRSR